MGPAGDLACETQALLAAESAPTSSDFSDQVSRLRLLSKQICVVELSIRDPCPTTPSRRQFDSTHQFVGLQHNETKKWSHCGFRQFESSSCGIDPCIWAQRPSTLGRCSCLSVPEKWNASAQACACAGGFPLKRAMVAAYST